MDHPGKIYMIGICGTGMGSLALLLNAAHYQVTGSDTHYDPPISHLLNNTDIRLLSGYAPQHLNSEPELVVVGNAVAETNCEVEEARRRQLPILSFPQALARFFLQNRMPIVVAGTHGKTTTSALMAWTLRSAGRDPGYLIGGWPRNFPESAKFGGGDDFVVEGDEYHSAFFDPRPKFLHYRPHKAILTSIEFDHGDIFKNLDEVKSAFFDFVKLIPPDGVLVADTGHPHFSDVIRYARCPVISYGLASENESVPVHWSARAIQPSDRGVCFEVMAQGRPAGQMVSPLLGRHNVRNALAVIALSSHIGLSMDEIRKAIISFRGIRRRQEILAIVHDIVVMDDFAHHPTAVRETLEGIRMSFQDRRIWAVFEPRSATSRRKVFQSLYRLAFGAADQIIISDLYRHDQIPEDERLDPAQLASALQDQGCSARFIPTVEEILEVLSRELAPGDLVCMMSSGPFGGIHTKLQARLSEIHGAEDIGTDD